MIRVLLALSILIAAAEVGVRCLPQVLPDWYRAQFPAHGVEFDHPGLLSVTPIVGCPLPGTLRSYRGPPPQGLVDDGLVAVDANPDVERWPRIALDIDAHGFPNDRVLARADIVLVGDSFALLAGQVEPPGLQSLLGEALDRTVYNLGVAGIGPHRERWLLEVYGLKLQPRVVVWLFFGGNDVADAEVVQGYLDRGIEHYSDLEGYRAVPAVVAFDLLAGFWSDSTDTALRGGMPRISPGAGTRFRHGPDAGVEFWFTPMFLRAIACDSVYWRRRPGLDIAFAEIRAAHQLLALRGIDMLLVYVPSKPEALLPHVLEPFEPIARMASQGIEGTVPLAGEQLRELFSRHRGALEILVGEFATSLGIEFLSATPSLERQAERGELGYYSADSHWNAAGQAAFVGDLVHALRRLGL